MHIQLSTEYHKTHSVLVYMEDLGIEVNNILVDKLQFRTDTYDAFRDSRNGSEFSGIRAYGCINEILQTLPIHEKQAIAKMFILSHQLLQELMIDGFNIPYVITTISTMLVDLDNEIDLCKKLYIYARTIPIEQMEGAGTRSQDTEEMTFSEEEMTVLISLALLCKLISPIMGDFISKCKQKHMEVPTENKEIHCFGMLTGIFQNKYQVIYDKLDNYIRRVLKEFTNKLSKEATAICAGMTADKSHERAKANLFVKRFVGLDLHRPNGNLMKYIVAIVRISANSERSSANSNSAALFRQDKDSDGSQEEGNTSRLEAESSVSIRTADTPILVKIAAERLLDKVLIENNIDAAAYNAALAYYSQNPIMFTPINLFILCSYYGEELGGGFSVKLLGAQQVIKLVTALQFIMFQCKGTLLLHALSFVPTLHTKTHITPEDDRLKVAWASSLEYKQCAQCIPKGFGEKKWDAKLRDIVAYLLSNYVMYNTAPVFWDMCQADSLNGTTFNQGDMLLRQLCAFAQRIFTYTQEQIEQANKEGEVK